MTGLEKMVDAIISDAGKEAEGIIAEAEKKALEIKAAGDGEVNRINAESDKKVASVLKETEERTKSSIDLLRRSEMLKAKQEVIDGIIEEAYEKIMNFPDEKYFDMLLNLVGKYARGEKGEIIFSAKDLKRLPEGFMKKVEDTVAKKGGGLVLSKETRDIDGGFVLTYGGIEENCSIRAIFDFDRDSLKDTVQKILF